MKNEQQYRLVVVIINYKTPELVFGALNSLENEISQETDRVVVVDNNSADGSFNKICNFIAGNKFQNWAEVIDSGYNGGFSYGNNVGINAYDGQYYFLLNSDAYVREGAIAAMISKMENDEKIGLLGPRIEWENGDVQVSCFKNMTVLGEFVAAAKTGIITRILKSFNVHEIAINPRDAADLQWISFAGVMMNCKLVNQIGLMDEGYFMYREDNDYCRRTNDAGFKIVYLPEARIVHLNQGASNQAVSLMPDFYYKSRSRYFIKFYGRIGLLCANIMWSLGRVISKIRELLTSKEKSFHSAVIIKIWKGFWQ